MSRDILRSIRGKRHVARVGTRWIRSEVQFRTGNTAGAIYHHISIMEMLKSLDPYGSMFVTLALDIARCYPAQAQKRCGRDLQTVASRAVKEGISFLTKTLPAFGKSVDTALATGDPLKITGFKTQRDSVLPEFLGWLLEDIFDCAGVEHAVMRETAPMSLKHLRQLLYLFYKLELPYAPNAVESVLRRFTDNELDLETNPDVSVGASNVAKRARALIHSVFQTVDPLDVIPRNGPGAVASGEKPWEKTLFKRYLPQVDACYPYTEFFYFNVSHYFRDACLGRSRRLQTVATPLSKAVLVPKDSRGPRLISMELPELQWVQQGLSKLMVDTLQTHWRTRGFVNFTDQRINQRLALRSSRDGRHVTLDMKDASDRVHKALVAWFFPERWVEALFALRSHGTVLPDGEVVQFRKYAPMGSALCFPVLATVVWAIAAAAIMERRNVDYPNTKGQVYVYGDDLVIDSQEWENVAEWLERFGLKLNREKCCVGTRFRESCGVDAYNGVIVTPIRLKQPFDTSSSLPVKIHAHLVALSNAFWDSGYYELADWLDKHVQSRKATPYTNGEASGIQFVRPNQDIRALNRAAGIKLRFHPHLHYACARTRAIRSQVTESEPDYHCLLDTWTKAKRGDLQREVTQSIDASRQIDRFGFETETVGSYAHAPSLEAGQYSAPHRVEPQWGWKAVKI